MRTTRLIATICFFDLLDAGIRRNRGRGEQRSFIGKLATAIEMKKGPSMNIDDHDYRWVDDRIRFMERDDLELTKDDMIFANNLWIIYR